MIKRHTNSTAMKQGKPFSVFLQEIRSQNTRKRENSKTSAHHCDHAIKLRDDESKTRCNGSGGEHKLALNPIEKHSQKQ